MIRKERLTDAQRAVLAYVKGFVGEHGYPPTRAEICDHFEWSSVNGATQHLQAIERRGYIKIVPGIARGITVL